MVHRFDANRAMGAIMARSVAAAVVILTLVFTAVNARAQTVSGQITGVIKDSTGAVVPRSHGEGEEHGNGFYAHDAHKRKRRLRHACGSHRKL